MTVMGVRTRARELMNEATYVQTIVSVVNFKYGASEICVQYTFSFVNVAGRG